MANNLFINSVHQKERAFSPAEMTSEMSERIAEYGKVKLITNDHQTSKDLNEETDPDSHFCFNRTKECCYYTEEQFNKDIVMDRKLSIIHFNSRSLYANFDHIQDYLMTFKRPFNIIVVSETWINEDQGMEFYLKGYKFVCLSRRNKSGGGLPCLLMRTLSL